MGVNALSSQAFDVGYIKNVYNFKYLELIILDYSFFYNIVNTLRNYSYNNSKK